MNFKIIITIIAAIVISPFVNAAALSDVVSLKGDLYFYAGGKKIPLITHTNVIGIKYNKSVTREKFSQIADPLQKIPNTELSFFEKHNIAKYTFKKDVSKNDFAQVLSDLKKDSNVKFALPGVRQISSQSPMLVTDTFLVSFKDSVTQQEIDNLNKQYNAVPIAKLSYVKNGYVMKVSDASNYNVIKAASAYYESGKVDFSHPDFVVERALKFTPNDTYYPNQWHLNNTGQNGAKAGEDVDAPEAWDTTSGDSSVIVAVLDTGIDIDHEDLSMQVVSPWDVVGNDNNPRPDSSSEKHGTAVSGVAVAKGNNGIGVSGAAPECKLMPIRLIVDGETLSDEAEAFTYAADNGASVITNSWGPADNEPYAPIPDAVRASIDYAVKNGRSGKGCSVLFAAGNGNENVNTDGYASYRKVLAVAACTDQGVRSYYSDFGNEIDVCAPSNGGVTSGIWTTDRTGMQGYSSSNYASNFGGTSSASPLAAGICALIISVNPDLNYVGVKGMLEKTATKIDPGGGAYDEFGHSIYYGFGRVNAYAAVSLAASDSDTTPPNAVSDLLINPDTYTLSWTAPGDDDTSGTAFMYDIRYSENPITSGNFDDASDIIDEPYPAVSGTSQTLSAPPGKYAMQENKMYYIAMRTYDEFGNCSDVSNNTTAFVPQREVFFSDTLESGTGNWESFEGSWGLTSSVFYSSSHSLTDTPTGSYTNNSNTSAVMKPIDLLGKNGVILSFYEKYSIEESYDYGYVEISDNGGASWSLPLSASTGTQSTFTERRVDLSNYAGKSNIRIRFRLMSDSSVTGDGWYIDDIKLLSFPVEAGMGISNWMLYN